MAKANLSSLAAGGMSLFASVLLIYLPEIDPDGPRHIKLTATLAAAVSLYLVFAGIRWVLFRVYYGDLLGCWYYSTKPHEDVRFKDVNFARMIFKLGLDGDLSYEVDLYGTLDALRAMSRERRGRAESLALTYAVESKCVELVFRAEYFTGRPEDLARKGRLSLHLSPGGLLEGDYISEVWHRDGERHARSVSSGRMIAARTIYDLEKAIAAMPHARERTRTPSQGGQPKPPEGI